MVCTLSGSHNNVVCTCLFRYGNESQSRKNQTLNLAANPRAHVFLHTEWVPSRFTLTRNVSHPLPPPTPGEGGLAGDATSLSPLPPRRNRQAVVHGLQGIPREHQTEGSHGLRPHLSHRTCQLSVLPELSEETCAHARATKLSGVDTTFTPAL